MPRIEILVNTEAARKFLEESGNGSSTFDLCAGCAEGFEEGDEVPDEYWEKELCPYNGEPSGPLVFGSTEVDHPPYDDPGFEHSCALCNEPLTEEDD